MWKITDKSSEIDKYNYVCKNINKLSIDEMINIIKSISECKIITNILIKLYRLISFNNFMLIMRELDDEIKLMILPKLVLEDSAVLITNLSDDKKKIPYIISDNYSEYRYVLVASLKEQEEIIKYFSLYDSLKFRINLINRIDNDRLRIKLINLMDNDSYKIFMLSNYEPYRSIILDSESKKMDDISVRFEDIDKDITIGIELEVCHNNIYLFEDSERVLGDFLLKDESTLYNGFEINSPVIHYVRDDLLKLYSVCEILSKSGFYTNNDCGGHIHIGINCFNSSKELLMMMYIYCNCENIFYLIANRVGSSPRRMINTYAGRIKKRYELAINKGDFVNYSSNIWDIVSKLRRINIDRYNGLNIITPYDTIEFRMANGEICFTELIHNIRLFLMLVQKSIELSKLSLDDEKYLKIYKLSSHITEEEKLKILLELLFDREDERLIYIERYYGNTDIFYRLGVNTFNYFDQGVNFDKMVLGKKKVRKK